MPAAVCRFLLALNTHIWWQFDEAYLALHTHTRTHRSPPTYILAAPTLPSFVSTQFVCVRFYVRAYINDDYKCQSFYSFTTCWPDLGFGLLNFDLELSYLHT